MVPDTSSASASGDRVASIGWGDREPWEAELRLLFTSPRGNSAWEKCSALLAMVPREIGAKGGVPEFQLKEMFRRALDYADSHELERALPADYEAARTRRAFRHGVRGTFQLVRPDRSAANPLTEREQRLAFVGLRQSLANVRRLAGLWWADEMDKPGQRTARTLAVWGSSRDQLDAFCEQLVDDLRHYIQPSPDPVGRAEGPDESSEFREYASALASALDIASPGYPRPLTPTALAPLLTLSRLRSSEPQSSASDRSLYAARGTRGGEAVRTSLRSVDRAIVLGDPGGGKSTVLADVLIDSVRGRREPAVVWCRLADLASQLTTLRELPDSVAEILELLADAGRVSLGILVRPDVDALVKALRGPDGGVIALDGLDEVPEDKRSMVEAIIRRIDVVGAKIIVTSRHTGYRPFVQGWTEFCVDQLEPDAADRFIGAWFSDVADVEPARRARAAIAESGDASIGKVPVLLGIVARVASSGDVPTNIGELYGRYLDLFLAQEWRGGAGSADAGSMHRRLDVMQRLAWSMALSGSDNVTGASWSDVMTLSELYESAGVGDQMALVDIIVSRDGALVPHGPHAYRGAQSFRWIHRSVHEYLVGAHLAGLLRRDRPRWQSHFEAILQGSLAWVEPTRFMVALLSTRPDALDAVFDFGHRFRHLGDPGHVILDRLRSMSEILPPDSRHRAKIARAYVQLGNYSSAQMTHEPTWRTAYLAALRSQDETEVLNALRQAGPVLNGPERAQEVEVLDAIEHSSERIALTRSGAACYAIEAFGKHRPDTQLLLYAKLLMLGMPRLLPPDYEYEKYTLSAVGAALRIVAAGSDDVRRSLLHHVLFTGSPLPTGVDAPAWVDEAPAYQAFTACGEYGQVSAERFTDLRETAVLAGHLGDHFAYQYGRMGRDGSYEASRNGEIAPCAWANVGVWLSDLFADPYQPRSSRKVPWLRVDGSVEDSAFVAVDLADPEHILVLVRLLLRWSLDPSGAQLTQLVQLYRRLLGTVSDLDAHGLARQPHGYATTLLVSCVEQVLGRHGARAAREILSTDSEDWEGVPGEPLLRALAASGLDSEGLVDLVVWGLLGGMDILGEWSYPTGSAAEWLSLADERGIRPADLPFRGRQQLASWLARDGQLPRWRNEFLRIAQNGEPTGLQVQ